MTIYPLLRRAMFRLDPERAHDVAAAVMRVSQATPLAMGLLRFALAAPASKRNLWGLSFRNPIGIAAGFDKNAELIPFLAALGFGFIEIGTVTLNPQSGNPKPRLFRIPEKQALINRMGFNNDGADVVAERLAKHIRRRVGTFMASVPVFANIGKNREVSLEEAPAAYEQCYRKLAPFADGIVVNVSSPNTPSLRDLQAVSSLREIIDRLRNARQELRFNTPGSHPILVKIAPDLAAEDVAAIGRFCVNAADGVVATNTTIERESIGVAEGEAGGLSGRPLFEKSTKVLRQLRAAAGRDYPIIGAGGVLSGADAVEKLAAGADLVQVYTGFIYRGPAFARELACFAAEPEVAEIP